jgi:hypothetical protein
VVNVTLRPRFSPGEVPLVPIVQEAGWAPEPVWTQRTKEKSFASAGDRTSIARSSSPQPHTILPELPRLPYVYQISQTLHITTVILLQIIFNDDVPSSSAVSIPYCGSDLLQKQTLRSAGQEISRLVWNPKVYYRVHKTLKTVSMLSKINPIHTPSNAISKTSILILSVHLRLGLPSGLFQAFCSELYTHFPSLHATRPVYLILRDLIMFILCGGSRVAPSV